MHKIHWAPILIAGAAGFALSALPSNAAANNTAADTTVLPTPGFGGSEIIHGIIVLAIVGIAVCLSHLSKQKS